MRFECFFRDFIPKNNRPLFHLPRARPALRMNFLGTRLAGSRFWIFFAICLHTKKTDRIAFSALCATPFSCRPKADTKKARRGSSLAAQDLTICKAGAAVRFRSSGPFSRSSSLPAAVPLYRRLRYPASRRPRPLQDRYRPKW